MSLLTPSTGMLQSKLSTLCRGTNARSWPARWAVRTAARNRMCPGSWQRGRPARLDRRAIPMLVSKSKDLHKYGTGVIVGPTTILTANHVAADKMDVVLPRAAVKGRAVCRARNQDLAVVKAPLPRGHPTTASHQRLLRLEKRCGLEAIPNENGRWPGDVSGTLSLLPRSVAASSNLQ